jgi:hypothetical protein
MGEQGYNLGGFWKSLQRKRHGSLLGATTITVVDGNKTPLGMPFGLRGRSRKMLALSFSWLQRGKNGCVSKVMANTRWIEKIAKDANFSIDHSQ